MNHDTWAAMAAHSHIIILAKCRALFFPSSLFALHALLLSLLVVHFVQAFDSGLQSLHKLPVKAGAAMDGSIARNEFYWTLIHCPDFLLLLLLLAAAAPAQRRKKKEEKKFSNRTPSSSSFFSPSSLNCLPDDVCLTRRCRRRQRLLHCLVVGRRL